MRLVKAFIVLTILTCVCFAEDVPRKLTRRVDPRYPELAKRLNATGTVRLRIVVAKDGGVTGVTILGGHPLLAVAAEDAVKKWRYEPGPQTTQTVEFHFEAGQ